MHYRCIKDRKIKAAIVGCGRIASKYFESIALHNNNIELVAVCDDNLEVLEAHALSSAPFWQLRKNATRAIVTW